MSLLRRSPLRRGRRRSAYSRRPRNIPFLAWLKTQPCALAGLPDAGACRYSDGASEADHVGPRGLSNKGDDTLALPKCSGHHDARTNSKGFYALARWGDKYKRKAWQLEQAAEYYARFLASSGLL